LANVVKLIIKCFIGAFINSFFYIISLLVPKSKDIWIFGGWFGNRFSDNSRYLYLYCNEFKEDIGLKKAIWITENDDVYNRLVEKGLEVYKKWSLKSIWYHLRCSAVFVDQGLTDVNKFFCIRSMKVNLWHGFPLKKIGTYNEDIKKEIDNIYSKSFKPGGWSKQYLLGTSNMAKEIFGQAFLVPQDRIIVSGYPRNDVFTKPYYDKYLDKSETEIINKIKKFKDKGWSIVSYFPTFRDNKDISLLNVQNEYELNEFVKFLEANKILFVTKFHFASSNSSSSNNYESIMNLSSNMDIYPVMKHCDVLITDYSSVYFDFMITGRPIIFYPFDLDYYSNENRGLLFDYNEFTPGPKVFNIEELKQSIIDTINNPKDYDNIYEDQYNEVRNKVFDNNTKDGSKGVVDNIRRKL
jgi:CDP-glycerol glycerophosphotransferase (TagB/SpsB family)